MTSTMQLAVGQQGSYKDIFAAWLKYNNSLCYLIKTSQNTSKPQARYLSVCYTAPVKLKDRIDFTGCTAHIKAIGSSHKEMTITSLVCNHTCDRQSQRKRNYLTRQIENLSDIISVYQPAKSGNTKQFIQMAKAATGLSLKSGQASNIVHKKCHDTLEACLGQYLMMPSLLAAYEERDPEGTYIMDSTPCL
jgi:hypothetical protein